MRCKRNFGDWTFFPLTYICADDSPVATALIWSRTLRCNATVVWSPESNCSGTSIPSIFAMRIGELATSRNGTTVGVLAAVEAAATTRRLSTDDLRATITAVDTRRDFAHST